MGNNPRNVDTDDLGPGHGGTGTHAANRTQAAAADRDNKAVGREGHRADSQAHAGHPQQRAAPGEPMTEDQAARLRILSQEAAEPFDGSLDRVAADRRFDDLQRRAGHKP